MACCAVLCPRSLTLKPCAMSTDREKLCGFSTFRWLCKEGSSKPISWASGGTESSSPLSDPEAAKSRFPPVIDSTLFGRTVLTDVLVSVARLWTCGTLPRLEVWGPWSKARGWRATVGRMISEDWSCPLGNHSQLLEPSWCPSFGGGVGFWVAAMETGCWGVWLICSSRADVTSADSASKARAPAEKEKVDDYEVMWKNLDLLELIYTIKSLNLAHSCKSNEIRHFTVTDNLVFMGKHRPFQAQINLISVVESEQDKSFSESQTGLRSPPQSRKEPGLWQITGRRLLGIPLLLWYSDSENVVRGRTCKEVLICCLPSSLIDTVKQS